MQYKINIGFNLSKCLVLCLKKNANVNYIYIYIINQNERKIQATIGNFEITIVVDRQKTTMHFKSYIFLYLVLVKITYAYKENRLLTFS